MTILLDNAGKRYGSTWIFHQLSLSLAAPVQYAILGANGAGKSTLLRVLAGIQAATEGTVSYIINEKGVERSDWFRYISYCAPGMDIPEELTPDEFFRFHFSFRQPLAGLTPRDMVDFCGLSAHRHRAISDFSSGMKQRIKLAQAIFTYGSVLLLDEPCTNLDEAGVILYLDWIARYAGNRLVIVASNDPREYNFCTARLELKTS